jgi:hypothetical protein
VIDFRYHLVSIVSIFLALAVGIVLGAGPLKGNLGQSLNDQLSSLRQDKATLRTQLAAQQKGLDQRDTFADAVTPSLVAGTLTGKTVTLVVAPGADADLVKKITATLAAAGAKVGSTVTLTDAWADPSKRTFRNNLATQLAALVKAPGAVSAPDMLPGTVLARAVLAGSDRSTDGPDAGGAQALEGLKAGNLLSVSPDRVTPASSAVVIGGPVQGSNSEDTQARLAAWVYLARALDAGGSGAVVVGSVNKANPDSANPIVSAVRADSDASKVVSTLDDADLSIGAVPLVQALVQQYAGKAGQYGVASDAKAVLPEAAK